MTRDRSFNRSQLIILMIFFLLFLLTGVILIPGFITDAISDILSLQIPDIRLSTDRLEWSAGCEGTDVDQNLTVYNDGDGTLKVTAITSDNPWFYTTPESLTVIGFDSAMVTITLDWNMNPDTFSIETGTLTIISNDPDEEELFVSLDAQKSVPPYAPGGDVTKDGVINILDVLAVANHIIEVIEITDDWAY